MFAHLFLKGSVIYIFINNMQKKKRQFSLQQRHDLLFYDYPQWTNLLHFPNTNGTVLKSVTPPKVNDHNALMISGNTLWHDSDIFFVNEFSLIASFDN